MSEGLADERNQSTPRLETLYRRWARSGAGLLLSGNMQVDREYLERPGNVVIDSRSDLEALRRLVAAGTEDGAHFWAQISHTGRQVEQAMNASPLGPSDVALDPVRGSWLKFAPPRSMTESDIERAIAQFAFAARTVREAGFTGVELHAAHGYLISQFLSPLSNRRTDQWGGSLENRSRFLLTVIAAVRKAVGPDFPVAIKLNASDFQTGGFTNAECVELVTRLNDARLDLVELSGGSLEQPKVVGVTVKDEGEDGVRASTHRREAYFIGLAGAVRVAAKMPVMVTGGFRTVAGMTDALSNHTMDLVGLGRPFIADPDVGQKLLAGEVERVQAPEGTMSVLYVMPWNNMQLERLGDGLEPDLSLDGMAAAQTFTKLEEGYLSALLAQRGSERESSTRAVT